MSHPCICIFAYLNGFKKGEGVVSRGQGVCDLICRSLFHYYGDYSTILPFKRERGTEKGGRGGQREGERGDNKRERERE
jgi:hypothetical protein